MSDVNLTGLDPDLKLEDLEHILPSSKLRKIIGECKEAIQFFEGAQLGFVSNPVQSWNRIEVLLIDLAETPLRERHLKDHLPGATALRISTSRSDCLIFQLALGEGDYREEITLVASAKGTELHEAQLLRFNAGMGTESVLVSRSISGWDVELLAESDMKTTHYSVDESGASLDMNAEAVKSREGLNDLGYLRKFYPDLFPPRNTEPSIGLLSEDLGEDQKGIEFLPLSVDSETMDQGLSVLQSQKARQELMDALNSIEQSVRAMVGAGARPVMTTVDGRGSLKPDRRFEVAPDTDPRFISATKEFVRLQSDFSARAINKNRFQAEVEKLKLRDDRGDWWAIDPDKYQWMRFDGKNWLAAEPPKVKARGTEKIVKPAEEERPKEKPLETGKVTPEPTAEIKAAVQPPPTPTRPSPAPSQPSCPGCNAPIKEGALFCGSCGQRLEKELTIDLMQPLCPQCNTPIRPEARFCGSCGTTLTPQPRAAQKPAPELPPSNICPRCRAQIKAGAKFCTSCGQAITSKTQIAQEGVPPVKPSSFCPHCGGQLKIGAKFCTGCGKPSSIQAFSKLPPPLPRTDIASGIVEDKRTLTGLPSVMNTTISYLPGVAIDFMQHWPSYSKDPVSAVNIVLPSLLSIFSVGISPKIGKWVSLILVVVAFGWLLVPFFTGGNVVDNSGRGIVGISFFYTITRLLRATQR